MKQTILVVGDEPIIRMSLADHLESEGFRVHEAGSGDRAIEILKAGTQVDLIVTDIQLPGEHDGISLALWARASHPHIKLILVSGAPQTSSRLQPLGPEGVIISKPYALDQVSARAATLLK